VGSEGETAGEEVASIVVVIAEVAVVDSVGDAAELIEEVDQIFAEEAGSEIRAAEAVSVVDGMETIAEVDQVPADEAVLEITAVVVDFLAAEAATKELKEVLELQAPASVVVKAKTLKGDRLDQNLHSLNDEAKVAAAAASMKIMSGGLGEEGQSGEATGGSRHDTTLTELYLVWHVFVSFDCNKMLLRLYIVQIISNVP
jgi:hypothetical protein